MSNILEFGGNTKRFFKRNYSDVLEIITPKFYIQDDIDTSGLQVSPLDQVINSHILLANNFSSIFHVSSTSYSDDVKSLEQAAQYFIKQNGIGSITPFNFESKIMFLMGDSFANYGSSALFSEFLTETYLPTTIINQPTEMFGFGFAGQAHDHLINNTSWLYFLNKPYNSNLVLQPSSIVHDLLVTKTYAGEDIVLSDAIKGVTKYIWHNYGVCSLFSSLDLIPSPYLSGTSEFTSGTQALDNLLTLIDIVYSPLQSDNKDTRVKEAFEDFISTEVFLSDRESAGAFKKFLNAISYSIYDINDEVEGLNLFYNIETCPEKFLPYMADLIGWELIGHNPDKWRSQLRNATAIYKAKGTKKALQIAVNTLFGDDIYDLSGSVEELYESYIPNILYYALNTAAPTFDSFSTWTPHVAQSLGVLDYSNRDMDTNVRFAVDYIIKDTVTKFPEAFFVGNKQFNLSDSKFIFYYRDRIFNIPPWESEKFYKYCHITEKLLSFLEDKLICFGVNRGFAELAIEFIRENSVLGGTVLATKNNWLFFTTENKFPPNKNDLLSNFEKEKTKYMPMWNSKSSHFNLSLLASSFTFSKFNFDSGSTKGLNSILRVVNLFSPAHSIPLIDLNLSSDDFAKYLTNTCITSYAKQDDLPSTSSVFGGYFSSGTNMSFLGRNFSRGSVDNLGDAAFSTSTAVGTLSRTSFRRRNYKNIIPKDGWFDRTGLNMPNYFATSAYRNYLTSIPLGYIPSSNSFEHIDDFQSLPAVYGQCENLDSSTTYNGVATSSTFPARGLRTLDPMTCIPYATRGECHPIIPVIHKTLLQRAYNSAASYWLDPLFVSGFDYDDYFFNVTVTGTDYVRAFAEMSAYVGEDGNMVFIPMDQAHAAQSSSVRAAEVIEDLAYVGTFYMLDLTQSLANHIAGPRSQENYFSFRFGDGVHRIYSDYIKYFGGHDLNQIRLDRYGGRDIFSHTYGPLVYNGYFNTEGSATVAYPGLIASSFSEFIPINSGNGSGLLSVSGAASGTYIASATSSMYVERYEFRNPHILSGIEFVQTSGDSGANEFIVYNVANESRKEGVDPFSIENPLIKLSNKSTYGLPRLRFDFNYGPSANILIPEHDFNLETNLFVGREHSTQVGGGGIGVWIHTALEGNYFWSWTPNKRWEILSQADLSIAKVKDDLAHTFYIPLETLDNTSLSSLNGPCLGENQNTSSISLVGVNNITSSLFKLFNLDFDTRNDKICLPSYYYKDFGQVHKISQRYVIEIYSLHTISNNMYSLLDYLSIIDKTENNRASEYSDESLIEVLRYFSEVSSDRGSRNSVNTSSLFATSGGSRINYRHFPEWGPSTKDATGQYTSIEVIN